MAQGVQPVPLMSLYAEGVSDWIAKSIVIPELETHCHAKYANDIVLEGTHKYRRTFPVRSTLSRYTSVYQYPILYPLLSKPAAALSLMPRVTRALQQFHSRFGCTSPGNYRADKAIASAEAIESAQRRRVQLTGRHGVFISQAETVHKVDSGEQASRVKPTAGIPTTSASKSIG